MRLQEDSIFIRYQFERLLLWIFYECEIRGENEDEVEPYEDVQNIFLKNLSLKTLTCSLAFGKKWLEKVSVIFQFIFWDSIL